MRFKVSDIKTDDNLVVSSKTVKFGTSGNFKFQTPLKPSIKESKQISPVHEIYKNIQPSTLTKCLNDANYDSTYCRGVKQLRDEKSINIFSLSYNSKDVVPDDDHVRTMADIQYVNSDVVVIPSWHSLIRNENKTDTELYTSLSEKYLEYALFRNNKPVMASIPVCIPNNMISGIISRFVDANVTSFILDFGGRSMTNGTWLRNFTREWDSYNIEDEGILYSMNAFKGIDRKNVGYVEAKDFLGFATGVDVIGDKYVPRGSYGGQSNTKYSEKLFDRETYRYNKIPPTKYGRESIRIESVQHQIDEMNVLRMAVNDGESIKKILESKSIEPSTMNHLINLKRSRRNRISRIDDFFD